MTVRTAMHCTMALALLSGTAATQQAPDGKNPQNKAAAANAVEQAVTADGNKESTAFKSWKEKLSYAFGADMAANLKWNRIDVDVDLMVKALKDMLAGKDLLMSPTEVTATLKRFQEERKQDLEHAKARRSDRNKREGEAFFAENVKKEGVVTLPSGLQYKILQPGTGKKPTINDSVVCNYRSKLLDGTEFDSSYKRNQPATVPVKGVIKGWSEALQLMPVGSRWELYIPPQLAFGDRIVGGIGPDAMLIFEVELISIKEPAKPQAASDNSGSKTNN